MSSDDGLFHDGIILFLSSAAFGSSTIGIIFVVDKPWKSVLNNVDAKIPTAIAAVLLLERCSVDLSGDWRGWSVGAAKIGEMFVNNWRTKSPKITFSLLTNISRDSDVWHTSFFDVY